METQTETQTHTAVEDNSPVASSASEPITSDSPATESAVGVSTAAVETYEEPERQPRPAQRRIQELVQQNKELKEQLGTVPYSPAAPQPPRLSEMVQGREDIMPDDLDRLGREVYEQGAQLARGNNGLEIAQLRQELTIKDSINETERTAAQLVNQYKELNPDSLTFNPILEKKIVDRFQNETVRPDPNNPKRRVYDPTVKLADVAREEVEFYRQAVEAGRSQSSHNLAAQADLAAVSPNASAPEPERSFDQMGLKEQENYLRAKGHDI